jgi:hypothetical protein
MLCLGIVHVAGVRQAFWAVWDRENGRLHERTVMVRRSAVSIGDGAARVPGVLELGLVPAGDPVSVVSDHHGGPIWTRKTPIMATGMVTLDGVSRAFHAAGIVDQSAGYHRRRTDWEWSAGVGTTTNGRALAWNLVTGLHDSPIGSERAVWIDGVPAEVGPVEFSSDLDRVSFATGEELRFKTEAVRRRRDNLVVIASDYVQPFGTLSGTLPDSIELATGYGVMERHHARW